MIAVVLASVSVAALLAIALVAFTRSSEPSGMSDEEKRCHDIAAIRMGDDMGDDDWIQSELDECLAAAKN